MPIASEGKNSRIILVNWVVLSESEEVSGW